MCTFLLGTRTSSWRWKCYREASSLFLVGLSPSSKQPISKRVTPNGSERRKMPARNAWPPSLDLVSQDTSLRKRNNRGQRVWQICNCLEPAQSERSLSSRSMEWSFRTDLECDQECDLEYHVHVSRKWQINKPCRRCLLTVALEAAWRKKVKRNSSPPVSIRTPTKLFEQWPTDQSGTNV